jgi:hypothetical protein
MLHSDVIIIKKSTIQSFALNQGRRCCSKSSFVFLFVWLTYFPKLNEDRRNDDGLRNRKPRWSSLSERGCGLGIGNQLARLRLATYLQPPLPTLRQTQKYILNQSKWSKQVRLNTHGEFPSDTRAASSFHMPKRGQAKRKSRSHAYTIHQGSLGNQRPSNGI